MRALPKSTIKKAILGLVLLSLLVVTPRSLAVDLLSPLIGSVDAPPEAASQPPVPANLSSPSATPFTSPSPEPTASPAAKIVLIPKSTTSATADSSTASAPPAPPKATASQSMRLAVPASVSVDPRAHSVFLPHINVAGVDTLLICGYTSASSVNYSANFAGVESAGNGTPTFRISGPPHLVTAAFNGDMGARLISDAKAVSGSVLSFLFISLDKSSTNADLCKTGNASNTRTISFRAIKVDLNMVKESVSLK